MSGKLFRGYDSLPQLADGWPHPPEVVDDWARRRAARVAELEMEHGHRDDGDRVWGAVYTLGICYGWNPAGTKFEHDEPNWEGSYFTNDGARVEDEDARALAQALERALGDIERAHHGLRLYLAVSSEWSGDLADAQEALDMLENAEGRAFVASYIKFLERGAFTIE